MDILLTFTGFHDPFFKGLVDQEDQPGPILSILSAKSFNTIYLFNTQTTEEITEFTANVINEMYPVIQVIVLDTQINDPTNYREIFQGLRLHIEQIIEKNSQAEYFIAVASGTPQMHACWLLLASSGEIPGKILHVRPPKFVTKERTMISEIELSSSEFPTVRFQQEIPASGENEINAEYVKAALCIIGDHPSMKRVFEMVELFAESDLPVLIYGETGTGKELIAKLIHRISRRSGKKFVVVNCAAIPDTLVESLLFGHKKGTFTGAISDQFGKFDQANEGILFLDEIGELPYEMQAKLLRVLQDGSVEPIGDENPHIVNVRIIAATNRELPAMVREGTFREDLYYRLNVGEIRLPPLRDRKSDIPKIALHVLDRINTTFRNKKRLTAKALSRLQSHTWPGNVRDLENVIERSILLSRKDVLDADDILITEPVTYADPLSSLPEPFEGFSLEEFLQSARKQMILRAVEKGEGNKSKAARFLGITPQAVHTFLKREHEKF